MPKAPNPLVDLTPEQRSRARVDAEQRFHRDWDPWPVLAVYGLALGAGLIVYALGAFVLTRASLAAITPVLLAALPLSHARIIRKQEAGSALLRFAYGFVVALALVCMAVFIEVRAMVLDLAAIILLTLFVKGFAEQALRKYLLRPSGRSSDDSSIVADHCLACGYSFDGLPRTVIRCPECGEVRIFPADSRLGLGSRTVEAAPATEGASRNDNPARA